MAIRTLHGLWRGSFDTENPWVPRIAGLRGSLMDRAPLLALRWTLLPLAAVLAAAMLEAPAAAGIAAATVLYGSLSIAFMAPSRGIGARRRFVESPLRDESRLTPIGHGEALAAMHGRILLGTLHALAFALAGGIHVVHEIYSGGTRVWGSDLGLVLAMMPIARPGAAWELWMLPWMAAALGASAMSYAAGYYLRATILVAMPHRGPWPVIVSFAVVLVTLFSFFFRMDLARDWYMDGVAAAEAWPAPPVMCVMEGGFALYRIAAALAIWKWLLAHPEKLGFGED